MSSPATKPTFGPYLLGKTIGEGEFGKVKLATHKATPTSPVAIKLIKKVFLPTFNTPRSASTVVPNGPN
jgi:serine/threonine protein kinase